MPLGIGETFSFMNAVTSDEATTVSEVTEAANTTKVAEIAEEIAEEAGKTTSREYRPASGSIVEAAAEETVVCVFDFVNSAPFVAVFHLETEGLPPAGDAAGDAAALTGPTSVTLAPQGGGSLRLRIAPPAPLVPGDYPVRVRVVAPEGDADPDRWNFVVRVLPPVSATADVPTADVPTADVPVPADAPPLVIASDALASPAPPENAAVFDAPTAPVAAPAVAPVAAPPEPPPTVAAPPRNTVPTPPQITQNAQNAPVSPPAALPAAPILTDLSGTALPAEDFGPPQTAGREENGEPVVQDPAEGAAFSVAPGQTLLIRFDFVNQSESTRTYVIDEDRSLPSSWIGLVQDQVNVSRSGAGHVSVRISPALDAEPGDYPFMVRVGPLGGVLIPRTLVLSVLPLPSVRLLTKEARLSVGPWGKILNFHLTGERSGNCDTAFRVAVVEHETDGDNAASQTRTRKKNADDGDTDGPQSEKMAGLRGGHNIVYETPTWQYLFDREVASLKSSSANRLPPPEPIRLRLLRKGWWWFGFRETHQVRVEAVPVNAPQNSGKGENAVDLTAVRWRLTPVPPVFLWALLLLLLPVLGGKVSNFMASNAVNYGGSYYVLQEDGKEDPTKPPAPMNAHLQWDSPWYASLHLRASANNKTTSLRMASGGSDSVSVDGYGFDRIYEIGPPLSFGASSERIIARFVPIRTENKLKISADTGTVLQSAGASDIELGADKKVIEGGADSFVLSVDRRGKASRLLLENTVDPARGLNINVWLASAPPDGFSVVGLNPDTNETSNNQILPGANKPVQITYTKPQGAGETDEAAKSTDALPEMVLITTDKAHQVVHVRLKLVP